MKDREAVRARRADIALCIAILAISLPPTLSSDSDIGGADTWLDALLLPTLLVAIPLRRRSPLLAAAVFAVACGVSAIPTFDQLRIPAVVAVAIVVAFTLGRESPRRTAIAGLGLLLVGAGIDGATEHVVDSPIPVIAFTGLLSGCALGAGRLIRSRERIAAELETTVRALEERREATARLAVEVERTRLASDLDAAARSRVRAIVELANAPPVEPDSAREVFTSIEKMGRESLNAMRELLGVLRSDDRARRAPGPTLGELDALLADARRGGRAVELEVEGERRSLPGGVELAAYRALQHALVAVRGAEGTPVSVLLRYLPDRLEIEVDGLPVDGTGAEAALAAASERIRAHGGSFDTTGASSARRVLTARLPLVVAGA